MKKRVHLHLALKYAHEAEITASFGRGEEKAGQKLSFFFLYFFFLKTEESFLTASQS